VTFTPADPTSYSNVAGNVNVAVANISTYYVVSGNPAQLSPFDTWGNAAADIQTAVNKASADLVPGTTECLVLVSNGTYNLTSSILITNGVTLRGYGGRDGTFINGNYPAYSNRCITISNTATRATVDGFTITNGYNRFQAGGGIYVTNSAVSVVNCTISRNFSAYHGGGIGLISATNVVITNCVMSVNSNAASGNGGGVYFAQTKGLMSDCLIVSNQLWDTGGYGGGVYVSSAVTADPTISNCTVAYNYSSQYGGGVALVSGGMLIRSTVNNNQSRISAGGVYLSGGGPLISYSVVASNVTAQYGGGVNSSSGSRMGNCKVIGNYAGIAGGGFYMNSASTARNCLFAGNEAVGNGGGVVMNSGVDVMDNCTVTRNFAGGTGGGVYAGIATSYATNNIVSGNQASGLFNDVGGATNGFAYSCSPDLAAGGNGNVSGDPLFVNPGSGFGTNAVLGDCHILVGSPAMDSGLAVAAASNDLEGVSRPLDGDGNGVAAFDMGAYEAGIATDGVFRCSFSTPTTIAMDSLTAAFTAYAAGPNTNNLVYFWTFGDGTTSHWSSATRVVSHAYRQGFFTVTLNVSNELGQVAVYSRPAFVNVYPTYVYVTTNGPAVFPFGSGATATTNIQDAVHVASLGRGYTIAVLVSNGVYRLTNQVTVANYVSIRSVNGQELTFVDGGWPQYTNRCFSLSAGAVLDGFTISNGYANGAAPANYGGGVLMADSTLQNCTIFMNRSGTNLNANGAGVNAVNSLVKGCSIVSNVPSGLAFFGAGIAMTDSMVTNCLIAGNGQDSVVAGTGGGFGYVGGTLNMLINCRIIGNNAKYSGGGYASGGEVWNSEFSGNYAYDYGAMNVFAAKVYNCLLIGNEASHSFGGVGLTRSATDSQMFNCTVVGNKSPIGAGLQVTPYSGSAGLVQNSVSYGNLSNGVPCDISYTTNIFNSCGAELTASERGNVNTSPQFVSAGNGSGTNYIRGNYHLKTGSPCLGTGASLSWMATAVDLAGDAFTSPPAMGAYQKAAASAARGALILIR
jgi:hypothetical protein